MALSTAFIALSAVCASSAHLTSTATMAYGIGHESDLAASARLETILGLALSRHPDLAAARARALASDERASALGRLPDLELKYEQWGVPLSRPHALGRADTLMLGLRQSFPPPGVLDARERAAEEDAKIEREAEASRARDLALEVRRAHAEYYRVDREYWIHLEHVEIASGIVHLARATYQSGRSRQEDVLRTMVELSRLHRDLAHIDQERASARALLNTLMSRDPGAPLGSPDEIRVPEQTLDPHDLEAFALRERPELRASAFAVAREEANIESASRSATWPGLMVGADYWLMPASMEVTHAYGAMVSVTLPWLNPRHREELRAAEQTMIAERRMRESAENRIRFEIHDAVARLNAAREAFAIIDRDLLPQSEQSFEAARAAFSAGTTRALDLLDALRTLLDVRLQRAQARAHWATAFADLQRAIGTPPESTELIARGARPEENSHGRE